MQLTFILTLLSSALLLAHYKYEHGCLFNLHGLLKLFCSFEDGYVEKLAGKLTRYRPCRHNASLLLNRRKRERKKETTLCLWIAIHSVENVACHIAPSMGSEKRTYDTK